MPHTIADLQVTDPVGSGNLYQGVQKVTAIHGAAQAKVVGLALGLLCRRWCRVVAELTWQASQNCSG
jgi:hypothetical protein